MVEDSGVDLIDNQSSSKGVQKYVNLFVDLGYILCCSRQATVSSRLEIKYMERPRWALSVFGNTRIGFPLPIKILQVLRLYGVMVEALCKVWQNTLYTVRKRM